MHSGGPEPRKTDATRRGLSADSYHVRHAFAKGDKTREVQPSTLQTLGKRLIPRPRICLPRFRRTHISMMNCTILFQVNKHSLGDSSSPFNTWPLYMLLPHVEPRAHEARHDSSDHSKTRQPREMPPRIRTLPPVETSHQLSSTNQGTWASSLVLVTYAPSQRCSTSHKITKYVKWIRLRRSSRGSESAHRMTFVSLEGTLHSTRRAHATDVPESATRLSSCQVHSQRLPFALNPIASIMTRWPSNGSTRFLKLSLLRSRTREPPGKLRQASSR